MEKISKPNKAEVRDWLKHRRASLEPLPDMEQIRQQLGWKLVKNNKLAQNS